MEEIFLHAGAHACVSTGACACTHASARMHMHACAHTHTKDEQIKTKQVYIMLCYMIDI